MLTTASQLSVGEVRVRFGSRSDEAMPSPRRIMSMPITMPAVRNAAGTAQRGARRTPTSQTSTIGTIAPGIVDQAPDRFDAQLEHDAGEHALRDGRRDARDESAECGPQPGDDVRDADQQERADGGRPPAVDRGHAGEQRRPGRRPGQHDRHAVAAAEPERADGLDGAEREQSGGGLLVAGADGRRDR